MDDDGAVAPEAVASPLEQRLTNDAGHRPHERPTQAYLVYVLPPREDWVVDRFVKEWTAGNADVTTHDPRNASVIWLLADWAWRGVPRELLRAKKVLTTVHHVVPGKFGFTERADFVERDLITDAYHVFNQRALDFIGPLTTRPIHLVKYWANQHLWRPTGDRGSLRAKYGLPVGGYLVGSFQRDTEGHDLKSPKLEKGPDLLADYLIEVYAKRPNLHVVLGGWRRQYIIGRLEQAHVPYTYFDLPEQSVVNELYQTLNLYPVTARWEGGPQSLIESALTGVPVISRPVGIAEQVLPPSAIHDDVLMATPAVPNVEAWKLPGGFEPYRKLLGSLEC